MAYQIKRAFNPAKPLSMMQRMSPHFAEEPRIGPFTLRAGQVLRLTDEQYKLYEPQIKKLVLAHTIIVEGQNVKVAAPPAPAAPAPQQDAKPAETPAPETPAVEPTPPLTSEPFPSPEQIAAAAAEDQKAIDAEIEKAVEGVAPVEEKAKHPRKKGK